MSLHIGARVAAKQTQKLRLPGTWSVWSRADSPGAYFLVPVDDTAYNTGLKYVVVRAQMGRTATEPTLTVIRTDPPRPDLIAATTAKKGTRR